MLLNRFTLRTCAIYINLIFALAFACGQSSEINGIVKNSNGEPLKDVFIYSRNDKSPYAWTDGSGFFHFDKKGSVISIFLKGYRPLIRPLQANEREMEITLENALNTEIVFSPCRTQGKSYIGRKLRIMSADNVLVDSFSGDDAKETKVTYTVDKQMFSAILVWGPMGSVGFPSEKWILNSTKYEVSSFKAGQWGGVAASGVLKNGKYWRFIGMSGEQLTYYDAVKSEAEFLDKIFNSICYQD